MKNTRNKIIILAGMLVLLIGSGVFAINQFFTAGINASEALSIRANKETVLVDEKFDITLNEQGTLQTDSEQLDSSESAADTDSQADKKVLEKEIARTKIQLPIGLEFDAEKTKQLNEQSDEFTATWDSDTRTIEIKWLEYQTKNELILALEAKTPGTYELEAIRQFNGEKETSEKLMIQVKELLQDSTAPVVEESIVNKSTENQEVIQSSSAVAPRRVVSYVSTFSELRTILQNAQYVGDVVLTNSITMTASITIASTDIAILGTDLTNTPDVRNALNMGPHRLLQNSGSSKVRISSIDLLAAGQGTASVFAAGVLEIDNVNFTGGELFWAGQMDFFGKNNLTSRPVGGDNLIALYYVNYLGNGITFREGSENTLINEMTAVSGGSVVYLGNSNAGGNKINFEKNSKTNFSSVSSPGNSMIGNAANSTAENTIYAEEGSLINFTGRIPFYDGYGTITGNLVFNGDMNIASENGLFRRVGRSNDPKNIIFGNGKYILEDSVAGAMFSNSYGYVKFPQVNSLRLSRTDEESFLMGNVLNAESRIINGVAQPGTGQATPRFDMNLAKTYRIESYDEKFVTLIEPTMESIIVGDTGQATAIALPENASDKSMVWSAVTSNVSVTPEGKVEGLSVGPATIEVSATDGSGTRASVNFQVLPILPTSIDIVPNDLTINPVDSKTNVVKALISEALVLGENGAILDAQIGEIDATDQTAIWSVSKIDPLVNPTLSTAGPSKQTQVRSTTVGKANITAKANGDNNVYKDLVVEFFNPPSSLVAEGQIMTVPEGTEWFSDVIIPVGEQVKSRAVVKGSLTNQVGVNQEVTWSSSNPNIQVDAENGTIKGTEPGIATITATTILGEVSGFYTVTVVPGALEFYQAPKDVDFGSKEISSRKKVYTPTEDVSMIIEDSRGKTANWELYLKVGKDLTLDSNEAISLPGALRFVNSSNEEVEINDQSGLVHSQTGSLSPMKTTVSWNRSLNQGLLLRVNPGQATKGSYTGELVWTLMDTAENEKSSSATTPD